MRLLFRALFDRVFQLGDFSPPLILEVGFSFRGSFSLKKELSLYPLFNS